MINTLNGGILKVYTPRQRREEQKKVTSNFFTTIWLWSNILYRIIFVLIFCLLLSITPDTRNKRNE